MCDRVGEILPNMNPFEARTLRDLQWMHDQYINIANAKRFNNLTKDGRWDKFNKKRIELYERIGDEFEIIVPREPKDIVNEGATSDCLVSKFYKFYGMMSKENTFAIAELRKSDFLWLRRISLVSFVNRVKKGDEKPNFKGFIDLMFTICDANKQYIERFNQLALGWLLREIAVVDYDRYEKWMKKNSILMTREAIRYTVEKITPKRKNYILSLKNNKDMENEEKHTKSKKKK